LPALFLAVLVLLGAQAHAAHETGHDVFSRALRRSKKALRWRAHLTVEPLADLAGGRRRGATWSAAAAAGFEIHTGPLGGWKGGKFDVQVMGLVRGLPHESHLVGDTQGVSNLYNSFSFLRLIDLSYRQRIAGRTLVRGGIMDVNTYFDTSAPASDLVNSSFGMTPTMTANVPLTPTAPYTGWGAIVRGGPSSARWRLGVFSGDPAAHGTIVHQGFFAIGEWQVRTARHQRLKIGAWAYHNPEGPTLGDLASPRSTNGFYGIWESHHHNRRPRRLRWGWFVETGLNPGEVNPVPYYVGIGFRLRGLPGMNPRSAFTAGVARAGIRGRTAETACEAAWDERLPRGFIVEPDLQYVMHPSGIYANAWVVLLRVRKDF
jgi:porin